MIIGRLLVYNYLFLLIRVLYSKLHCFRFIDYKIGGKFYGEMEYPTLNFRNFEGILHGSGNLTNNKHFSECLL